MPDKSLSDMLAKGEIDCAIIARPPDCFRQGHKDVVRLYPDFWAMEEKYYKETKVWPIMHIIALQKRVLDENPWVARNLYNAFLASKNRSVERLMDPAVSRYPVAWLPTYMRKQAESIRRRHVPLRHRGKPADLGADAALQPRAGHRAPARQAGGDFPQRHHDVDPGVMRRRARRLSRRARRTSTATGYFAAVLSTSAQACATAEFGSVLPGNVAQPPALT